MTNMRRAELTLATIVLLSVSYFAPALASKTLDLQANRDASILYIVSCSFDSAKPKQTGDALTAGQELTYEQEGERLGPYHPTSESGVTVGVGYDMKKRSKEEIEAEMEAAGVEKATAEEFSKAAGLSGKEADDFVKKNPKLKITADQSKSLFVAIYAAKADYAKSLATKADVVKEYGKTDWDKLDGKIKDVLIDLTFRGDYTSSVRKHVQKFVVANDRAGFKKAMSDKSLFTANLSKRRFQARVDHL